MTGIIFNPSARGEKARSFQRHLAQLGKDIRVLPTRGPGDARILARELVVTGCRTVVAAGGDGTVNEVLNGLADAPDGLVQARLAVIPLGTVNVFAKQIALPGRFERAWEVIQQGAERVLDLPEAEFTRPSGERERRKFILMAGTGLSARAIERVDWNLKKRWGPAAYIWAGVEAMRPPRPEATVTIGVERFTSPWVEIGNGEFYGGRFVLFPGAVLDDGQLNVTLLPRLNWLILARIFLQVLTRRLLHSPLALLRPATALTLESGAPLPFHLDGDVVGQLPATLTVQPQALRVVVP